MINKNILNYICCFNCKTDLKIRGNFLVCGKCDKKYKIVDSNILRVTFNSTLDLELSIKKWDEFYQKRLKERFYIKEKDEYLENHLEDVYRQITEYKKINKDMVYLEIGCGPMILGREIAKHCCLVIGIDLSLSALEIAKKFFKEEGIKNYLLIQGDILNMPLKSGSIDLIYGGGVIEHFKNTQQCVNELCRVLRKGGVSFNSVPYLNIGSTYRQIWGNIPNFPVLKQLAEIVHIKLLKSRHMRFGYELSFTARDLERIHKKAGFKEVKVKKFDIYLYFGYFPKFFRPILEKVANNSRLFWPMVKVIAKK